jgi:hypothetical protein
MDLYVSLQSRFKQAWRDRIETAVYHSMVGRAQGASETAAKETVAARHDRRLTPEGKLDRIRAALAPIVPPLARDMVRVRGVPERAAARRRELLSEAVEASPASADTISAALVRSEMRRHIASLDHGQGAAWLANMAADDLASWAAAILEAPTALSGLSAEMHARVVADAAARLSDPVKLALVADHEQAAELARIALDYVTSELAAATGLQPLAFVAWAIEQGSPPEAFPSDLTAAAHRQAAAQGAAS